MKQLATINTKRLLRFIGWFFLMNSLVFWVIGYGYLKNIVQSDALFKNSIANFSSISGEMLILFFALVNYLSYLMLLAFIPALMVWIIALFVPNKRFIFSLSILIASLSLLLFFADRILFSLFKFHLNLILLQMISKGQFFDLFDFSSQEVLHLIALTSFIILFELALALIVWKKIIVPKRFLVGQTIALIWLGTFLFSYCTLVLSIAMSINLFSQQTPNLPLYNQLMSLLIPDKHAAEVLYLYSEEHYAQPHFSNNTMQYPIKPLRCTKPKNPPNIILLMIDSLRFDSLTAQYMPNAVALGKTSWQSNQNLSGGNATQPGLFALFYSLPPSYWTATLEQKIPPVFMRLLTEYGYGMKILWSSEWTNPPFDKTLYLGLNDMHHPIPQGLDVGDNDRHTTQQAIQFLLNKHTKKPFFLNLFYDAAHGYCRGQSYPTLYKPAIEACSRIGLSNQTDPKPYHNRYLNAVHFVDEELGKVLKVLEQQGYFSNSVIIITSDHGQEFNDNKLNYWEHASNFTKAQMQVPLIIHWPNQKPHTINYLTSNYDLIPTLLKRLFNCQNPTSDYSIGADLLQKQPRLPFILAGSYSNRGIIEPDRITTLSASGPIVITDTQALPMPEAIPRTTPIKKALELMRRYYAK
ncbi:MAG: DUF3413 domain-containing protein [Legionellales bacterium]